MPLHLHRGNTAAVELLLEVDPAAINAQVSPARRNDEGGGGLLPLSLLFSLFSLSQDESGVTPLMRAAGGGFLEATRALLAAGANPDLQDGVGASALHWAAEEDRADIVRELLAAGAWRGME